MSKKSKEKNFSHGFTLIEMLLTVVIVSIISAVGIVSYLDFNSEARMNVTKKRMIELKKAIVGDSEVTYKGDVIDRGFERHLGSLPISLNDLITQGAYAEYDPFTKRGWRGPYVNGNEADWNLDSWGNPIQYDSVGRTLTSCGDNKTCGDADDIVINF